MLALSLMAMNGIWKLMAVWNETDMAMKRRRNEIQ